MKNRLNAVTLIELIISITIVSLLIAGIYSIDEFSRSHVTISNRRAKLQNELSYVLEHMTKNLTRAIGDKNNPPKGDYLDNRGFRIRIDSNLNGMIDGTDTWVAYRHINTQILFFPNATTSDPPAGTSEILGRYFLITTDPFSSDTSDWGLVMDNPEVNQFNITVRCRWDPNQDSSLDNPQVEMQTSVVAPSVSIN